MRMVGRDLNMAIREMLGARPLAWIAAPILILTTWAMLADTRARAQEPRSRFGGYMRMVSASGRVIAGESTDPSYVGWIPLRQTTVPSGAEMAASASASADGKSVHPPVVVVKVREDRKS